VSPGIGLNIQVPTAEKRTPRQMMMAALAGARGAGIPLCFGPDRLGVTGGAFGSSWVIDRKSIVRGVTIIGAALLSLQPEFRADEDPAGALARAMGVELAVVEGINDGWSMVPMSSYWTGSAAAQHYVNGFEVGGECRFMVTLVCRRCASRRFRDEAKCPGCER
jgi:hypothetical protein